MLRCSLLAGLVVTVAASTAEAGPLSRFRSTPSETSTAGPSTLGGTIKKVGAPIFKFFTAPVPPDAPPPGTPVRNPRIAKFALATGPYWAPGAPKPVVDGGFWTTPLAHSARVVWTVFSYIGTPFTPIGIIVPPAIRATHIFLNGSHYTDRPIKTVLWIANPLATLLVDKIQKRRGTL